MSDEQEKTVFPEILDWVMFLCWDGKRKNTQRKISQFRNKKKHWARCGKEKTDSEVLSALGVAKQVNGTRKNMRRGTQ